MESCLAPLSLELIMIMGIYTGHPSVGMLRPFPPNRHVHRTIEHPGHAQRTPPSEHAEDIIEPI